MLNKNLCMCCHKKIAGAMYKIPGPALGNKLVDLAVCHECHDVHHDHMDYNFWKGASCSCDKNCTKCGELTSQNGRPIHGRIKSNGTYDVGFVCDCCHAEYIEECRIAMMKCKGEKNG